MKEDKKDNLLVLDLLNQLSFVPIQEFPEKLCRPIRNLLTNNKILIFAKCVEKQLEFLSVDTDKHLWTTSLCVCAYVILNKDTHEVLDTFLAPTRSFFIRDEIEQNELNSIISEFLSDFRKIDNVGLEVGGIDYEHSA